MKRRIYSPFQAHFVSLTQGVFVKTTSNSFLVWHFRHSEPLSRATPPGLCPVLLFGLVFPMVFRCSVPTEVSHRVSGSRYVLSRCRVPDTKMNMVEHVPNSCRMPDPSQEPNTVGFLTPAAHVKLSGIRHLSGSRHRVHHCAVTRNCFDLESVLLN